MGEMKNPPPAEYELRMKDGTDFWVREAGSFFEKESEVHRTLRDLVRRLKEAEIPYAIVGALALGQHGYVRVTDDIDVLITREGLQTFHEKYIGLGYMPAFQGSRKKIRATDTGVKIDMILAGEYPGDGKPKSVQFPDPAQVSFEANGMSFLQLEKLIELKLASGLSAPHRMRDLVDVQDLIRETHLPLDLSEKLDESVRDAYRDLWQKAQIPDPE